MNLRKQVMFMKKILATILVLIMVLAFAGCGKKDIEKIMLNFILQCMNRKN